MTNTATSYFVVATLPTRRSAAILAALLISIAVPAVMRPDDHDEEGTHPEIERAMRLFDEGRDARALKTLEELRLERPDFAADIQCAIAASENQRGNYAEGLISARQCAKQAYAPSTVAQARVELLIASAGAGQHGDELAERLAGVRRLLANRQDDKQTDAIRKRLCLARELLPDSHESSLAIAALPEGRIRFLPKADPDKDFETVKPERVFQRLVDQRFDGVDQLSGKVQATFDSTIDADGCFAAARLTHSTHPIFEGPALKAVRGWIYRPPRFNGTAVAMYFSASVYITVDHR